MPSNNKIMKYTMLFTLLMLSLIVPSQQLEYMITLPVNPEQTEFLKNKLLDISNPLSENWRNYLTVEQIRNFSQPSGEIRKPVLDWLKDYPVNCLDFGDSLQCNSTNDVAAKMWNLNMSPKSGALSGEIYIPEHLQDNIMFVEGLYQKKRIKNLPKVEVKAYRGIEPDSGLIGLEVLQRLYNFSKEKVSSSVASIEYQGASGFSQDDLNTNNKLNMLNSNNVSHIIGNDQMPDLETQLDLQMEALVANQAELWFWDDNGWLLSFATKFFNTKEVPDVISMSWGWAEDKQCDITSCGNRTSKEYVDRVNMEYVKIGLRGVSILTASGDAGAPGRTDESCDETRPVNPVMPGSSPWITSVSATFVNGSNKKINWKSTICKQNGCPAGTTEYPTNYNWTGWTTGGGFSEYDGIGKWQQNVVNQYLNSGVPLPKNFSKGRGYPDISMVGHNCPIVNTGQVEPVDGTSCSSPIAAGVIAILNDVEKAKGKKPLGFLNPLLYQMHSDDSSIFNDVKEGNNFCTEYNCCPQRNDKGSDFGYLSSKGWDPVTGLGTLNVGKMLEYLLNKK